MGYFVKRDKHGTEGMVIASGPTSERPITPITGAIRFNSDTVSLEYFNGTAFVDVAKAGNATPVIDKLVTDGATATYTMTVEETSEDNIVVFIDGVYQTPGSGNTYTVSSFDIVFTSIPPSSLEITIIHGLYGTYVPNTDVFDVPNL